MTNSVTEFWDDRYKDPIVFAYGKEANDFLKYALSLYCNSNNNNDNDRVLNALCLCEGEGRNAMYLAKNYNYKCDCIDLSKEGMNKLKKWSIEENVDDKINTIIGDLEIYDIKENEYDLIISIFAHTPIPIRKKIHSKIKAALKINGHYILEAYTPSNVGRGIGGPQHVDMCVTKEILMEELDIKTLYLIETERTVQEGIYHLSTVDAAVVQYVGIKES